MTVLVSATDLLFERPGGFALSVPSLAIEAGEAVAVLGASGTGKSTLLDLVGGVLRPTSGALALFGHDVAQLSNSALDRLRGDHVGVILGQSWGLLAQFGASWKHFGVIWESSRSRLGVIIGV